MILFEVTVCDLRMSTQIVDLKSQFATSKWIGGFDGKR